MEKILDKNKILVVETAFGAGSLAIFDGVRHIDSLIRNSKKSTAEDLLSDITFLLEKNNLSKKWIGKVLYTGGEGSRTGIRIGVATVKGLRDALGCELEEVSMLDALLVKVSDVNSIQTALQISQKEVIRQIFKITSKESFERVGGSENIPLKDFFSQMLNFQQTVFLTDKLNFDGKYVEEVKFGRLKVIDLTENLATIIGEFRAFKAS